MSCCLFEAPPTTGLYTLSLHDALPISAATGWVAALSWSSTRSTRSPLTMRYVVKPAAPRPTTKRTPVATRMRVRSGRSEEHTSELQSHSDLVCRLLLEKKKKNKKITR